MRIAKRREFFFFSSNKKGGVDVRMFKFQGKMMIKNQDGEYIELVDDNNSWDAKNNGF